MLVAAVLLLHRKSRSDGPAAGQGGEPEGPPAAAKKRPAVERDEEEDEEQEEEEREAKPTPRPAPSKKKKQEEAPPRGALDLS